LSSGIAGEYSSLHFAQFYSARFAAILQVRNWEHQLSPINFDSFFFGGFFRTRHCVPYGFALVRVELLLNSRLPQLTRVGRELRIARFTNPQGRDVADSFQDPKAALSHDHSFPYRRKPRHHHDPRTTAALGCPAEQSSASWRDERPRPPKPSPLWGRAALRQAQSRLSPVQPRQRNRTFSLFMRHCAACRARASLPSCFGNSY
jgi:hypothetical protein